jgi:hypothetical protein
LSAIRKLIRQRFGASSYAPETGFEEMDGDLVEADFGPKVVGVRLKRENVTSALPVARPRRRRDYFLAS